ncbi:tetratricopeptide repeat protein [Flagellimonas sp. 389]|uniref:tetratricopeptide repeat protein n=1 Tax=Flagellimonas sp. 389 TaxID=2835862 RepID=UPI001BD2B1E7|nr:tetratricopeptide repeat protein [Flagellimonas sp. 389]MBS9463490.1 tetratricopeptide repeat protein [Flagellimonas sp. 389]
MIVFRRALFLVYALSLFQLSCNGKKETYIALPKNIHNVFLSTKSIPDSNFLGSESCKECHKEQFEKWTDSHHDKAMQKADRETVLAGFKGEAFKSQGITSRFYEKDGDFFVNTEGPNGNYHDYKIVYTFGIAPLQQYIVQFPDGRYQCLRTAWDTENRRWFDLYPDFKVIHSEWLHWSRGGLNWNNMCADCHSTNIRKNYNEHKRAYNTKFAIINVSCEACHGPGKKHVNEVRSLGSAYVSHNGETMWMSSETTPKGLVDECARCHMRREQISEGYNFTGTMLDHYFPQLLEYPIYHPDGQILDEDYVYGSFIQSKMYQNNVSCNNCHDSHSLKLKFEGNKLCLQCHVPEKYDTALHHFHETGNQGAKCIGCHMPGKIYMGNDFRRDHSFRVPRPDLSIAYNTPNACTQCHTDKDDQWAWEVFKRQFGKPQIHFSELLAPGVMGEPGADIALTSLVNDSTQPEIARASAVKALSNYTIQNGINAFIALLNDESPLVRGATVDVLSEINSLEFMDYILPRLKDSKRAVRIKAFYALGTVPENQIPADYKKVYQKVKEEFFGYLKINADFPGGQARKAAFYQKKGDLDRAREAYLKALSIDGNNNTIRSNLANLYYHLGETGNAEKTFREVIKQEPEFGFTYYSLALLLAELKRTDEAILQMEQAHKLMPQNIRVIYNLGLLYQKKGRNKEAEKILVGGLELEPEHEELLYALAYHYIVQGQKQKAVKLTDKIIRLYPNRPQYQNMAEQAGAL